MTDEQTMALLKQARKYGEDTGVPLPRLVRLSLAEGERAERAAVVAWLRSFSTGEAFATEIEQGEHLKP